LPALVLLAVLVSVALLLSGSPAFLVPARCSRAAAAPTALVARAAEAPAAATATKEKQLALGGARTEAVVTGVSAGVAIFLLCAMSEAFKVVLQAPLYVPPLGAVSLIFASDAVAQARTGKVLSAGQILDKAVKTGTAVAGACIFTVLITQLMGASPLGRALAVAGSSWWMAASPVSGFFPPAGAFCALYVDQAIAGGPVAKLLYRYAISPAFLGTALLLILNRVVVGILARPLRSLAKA